MDEVRDIAALRQVLAGLEAERLPGVRESFFPFAGGLGHSGLGTLPLARGALHEVQAARGADLPAATGFALGLARLASDAGEPDARKPVLWVRQDFVEVELGRPEALGLAEFGLDPARLILVRAPNAVEVLRAAGDAARCAALGALIVEPWGEPKALDLTATRRLALRAAASGVTSLLLRAAAHPHPTAVASRWTVAPAASRPQGDAQEANAPGNPAFSVTLTRHRAGADAAPMEGRTYEGGTWQLEWDRETCSFRELAPLSRSVVPVPAGRPAGAAAPDAGRGDVATFRRTG